MTRPVAQDEHLAVPVQEAARVVAEDVAAADRGERPPAIDEAADHGRSLVVVVLRHRIVMSGGLQGELA
jgi:hypothetical protein